jgi:alpha-D-ribose 1-methylphosphonate 5-triphosphate synthase subunit PhnG
MSIAKPADAQGEASRRAAMALLARATRAELEAPLLRHWPAIAARDLKPAESGLVMVRGRIGGDGAPFNLGEASVTRCVVETEHGVRGYAFTLGRDHEKTRLAALIDALWQDGEARPLIDREVLAPIARRIARGKHRDRGETAATRVDFFTLVRGEAE